MNKEVLRIRKLLKNAKTALLVSHVDPDGDSIGSILAMGLILSQLGVQPTYYSKDGVPKIYRFVAGADQIKKKLDPHTHYDLLFALDASDLKRLGDEIEPRKVAKAVINVDHHPDNTNYGDVNLVARSSSTAELVYKFAKALKIRITKAMAENLYVALITDTGNYRYENTGVDTFLMAADLLKAGVDPHHVSTKIYDTKSVVSIRIQAAALGKLELTPDRKVAWVVVTREMMEQAGAKGEDLVGLVDQIRSIDGVEVAVLFRQEEGKVKINFRSKEKINVSEIARRFGGGGHIRAAGVVLDHADIEEVKAKVVEQAVKQIQAAKFLV